MNIFTITKGRTEMKYDRSDTDQCVKSVTYNYKTFLVILCFSAILAFFFLLNSPLHPWTNDLTGTDSSVFKTVALMMEKGYMPYKDSFDHKGPLLYILNWIGNQISYYRGIWVIEYGFLICTFYFIYKIARLSVRPLSAAITLLLSISLLFDYFDHGNLTEEYAMPFIAIGIYIFLDYLKNGVISSMRLVISGACFGAVVLLRVNMIAVWIAFCGSIFIATVIKKEWRRLGEFVVWFLAGAAIMIVPVITWLAANDALKQCWEDYIVFNIKYTSAEGGSAVFSAKWYSFFTFLNTRVFIIALAGILFNLRRQLYLNITYVACMILSLILVCMSGMIYAHYGMVLVPLAAYPVSLIFQNVESIENTEIFKAVRVLLSVYALSAIIVPEWIELVKEIPGQYEAKEDHLAQAYNGITDVIVEHTDQDDAISVYGNLDIIYVLSQRKHATRYSYQVPGGAARPEIINEYMYELGKELPPVIVTQHYDSIISDFLTENKYSLIWGEHGEQEDEGLLVFCRQS